MYANLPFFELFFVLMMVHALCDFALQNDYVSKAKNPSTSTAEIWPIVMTAHCLIHAGGVYFITGSIAAAAFQLVTHFIIDYVKCKQKISYLQDQWFHAIVMWIIALGMTGALHRLYLIGIS